MKTRRSELKRKTNYMGWKNKRREDGKARSESKRKLVHGLKVPFDPLSSIIESPIAQNIPYVNGGIPC